MRIVTKEDIEYRPAGYCEAPGFIIPKGTPCVVADNLPDEGQYWACEWDGMTDEAESWQRNYGFLLHSSDVVDRVEAVCRAAL